MDFPGNSNAARITHINPAEEPEKSETDSDPKKVKKVITGKVTKRDKPLGQRFKEMFFNNDGNLAEHIVENVVVPMFKDMTLSIATQMVDGFRQGVEEMLFGPDARNRTRTPSYGTGRPTRINYNSYSSNSSVRRVSDRPPVRRGEGGIRRSNRVKEIIVESREDGDLVLEELDAIIDSPIGHCTVGDFYAAVGESTTSTDEEWGWKDLRDARVRKISADEFLIQMPRPIPIDN